MTIRRRNERDAAVPLTRHARRELGAKIRRLRDHVIPHLTALRQDPDYDGANTSRFIRLPGSIAA